MAVLRTKVLKFDPGYVVMTVFEPIISWHFEKTLSQNDVVSNTNKRVHWITINSHVTLWLHVKLNYTRWF